MQLQDDGIAVLTRLLYPLRIEDKTPGIKRVGNETAARPDQKLGRVMAGLHSGDNSLADPVTNPVGS